ncbi:MAG: hypothetical protein JWN04_2683 [Myxococcaceae bacterium]|nr:hypothetical protein [Myxococcaceae bacterium]
MNPSRFNRCARAAVALAGVLTSLGGFSTQAHAQAWLPDRAYTEGPGVRVGDLELHPGIAVRGGYDNNVFKADGDAKQTTVGDRQLNYTQSRRGAGILAVTPHLYLSTLSTQRMKQGEDRDAGARPMPIIAFRGGMSATYFHYFIDNAPKNLEVDTDLWMGILPNRPFNIDLTMSYVRSVRPFTQYAGDKNAYNYDTLAPRARFNFGSRSQVLTAYVGYVPRVTLYESSIFNYLNSVTQGIEAGSQWKFLPSTALVYDANLDYQNYRRDDSGTTRSPVVFTDNLRFRTRLGLSGAITRTVSLRALAGYAAIKFGNKGDGGALDDHEDVIGEAILAWRFGPGQSSQLEAGYNRDVQSSPLGGWVQLDRGSASLRSLIGGVFMLSLEAGAAHVNYGKLLGYNRSPGATDAVVPLGTDSRTDRKDVRLDGAIRGEYRLTNWLSLLADVSAQAVITKFDYAIYFANLPVPDPARYWTVMAFGGVRAHY